MKILRFEYQGTDFTLVVHPARTNPPDRYMGACERFEVRGTFGSLRGSDTAPQPALTKQAHKDALQFLKDAFVSGQTVDLGWVDAGFVPLEASNPCVVKSRALQLVKDTLGTYVLSYHNAVGTR